LICVQAHDAQVQHNGVLAFGLMVQISK
jgi:hypothetical protein